jgi:energy-coupling factor transport system ATP-binding protein
LAAVVELNRVRYRYPTAGWVLNDLGCCLPAGQSTLVLGASGSGKSTLAYLLSGLIPHFFGGTLEGSVVVCGRSTREATTAQLFQLVGLVLQNTEAQLFNATVEDDIAFGLESLGLPAVDIGARIRRVSQALGIEHLLGRTPETLSGGEQRLAAIAGVLGLDPALVVLDEPFAGLDLAGTRMVREILADIPRRGKSLVVIEHRTRPFLDQAHRCLIIDKGAVRFDGPPAAAGETLSDLHLVPRYPGRAGSNRAVAGEPVLAVRELCCRMDGADILNRVSLTLYRGEAVAIVGENGAGKTTLVKHFNGLLKPTAGEVTYSGRSIRALAPAARAAAVGLCFQNPNDQFFNTDVRSEILAGPKRTGVLDRPWFDRICDTLNLHPLLERSPFRLSEGEKRRVALASVLVMRPAVLVLDEPTAGQDGRNKEALAGILAALSAMGITTVVVTHDLDFARCAADRWIVLRAGRIIADGQPDTLLAKLAVLLDHPGHRVEPSGGPR